MYQTYNARPLPQAVKQWPKRWPVAIYVVLTLLMVVVYVLFALLRPIPDIHTTLTPPVISAQYKVNVPWPNSATHEQSAYGAKGYGLLATSSTHETPLPTASVAKVITALAILNKKPLASAELGPTVTISTSDVAIYNQYVSEGGSTVPVTAGETFSEYQGLQAMMLPSANNIADSMAIWAFGSLDAYNTYANSFTKMLGMTSTTVTSASGFPPTTVSTAADLVRLGEAALARPVLADIVSQRTAEFPNFGTIYNVNALLGQAGVTGIKTGNTDQAGGCFLATANVIISGKTITVITAVMEAPSLPQALRDSLPLIQSAPSLFQAEHIVKAGQAVGTVTTRWSGISKIVAKHAIDVTAWTGTAVSATGSIRTIKVPVAAGAHIGQLNTTFNGTTQTSDLVLAQTIRKPSLTWRLAHPF